jgi:hypothetical protein
MRLRWTSCPAYVLTFLSLIPSAVGYAGQLPMASGTLRGVVLDGDGKPLPGANVYATEEADSKKQFPTVCNDAGQFTLVGLPEGTIYLSAFKESDGYPYDFFAFYASPGENTPIKLEIKAAQTIRDVRIQLGRRAARLNFSITDQDGRPLEKGASIIFTRLDQANQPYGRGARSNESWLVPPVPFRFSVEAKGFRTWHYGGDSWQDKDGIISLASGQILTLVIRLQRATSGGA